MSKITALKDQIAKSREELKVAFESQEDGKYTPEAKEKIKGLNTELAGLIDDVKIEEAKVQNEKAMEVDETPVNAIPNAEEAQTPKTIGEMFTDTKAYNAYNSYSLDLITYQSGIDPNFVVYSFKQPN